AAARGWWAAAAVRTCRGRRSPRPCYGFFPPVPRGEDPARGAKLGLQEFGLPFVADPAIPRHLSAFLRRHKSEAILPDGFSPDDRPARPDAILFNGGALTPAVVRDKLARGVASWFPYDPRPPYPPPSLPKPSAP